MPLVVNGIQAHDQAEHKGLVCDPHSVKRERVIAMLLYVKVAQTRL
jgi:hypothetical protein